MKSTFPIEEAHFRLNQDNRKQLYLVLIISYLLLTTMIVLLVSRYASHFSLAPITALILLLTFFPLRTWIIRIIATAYVKNRALIIKYLSNKALVLELKSIRKVNTNRIGPYLMTTICYYFDGKKGTALLIGRLKDRVHLKELIRASHKEKSKP